MKTTLTPVALAATLALAAFVTFAGRGYAQSAPSGYTFKGGFPTPETVKKPTTTRT